MPTSQLTRIERSIFIRAPRARVWKAISQAAEFGAWFRVEAEGEFTPGARVRMTSTHPTCLGVVFHVVIDQMVPGQILSWRWHPGAEPDLTEPETLVEFRLADAAGGTTVTVIESGFDRISLARRAAVFEDNDQGWKYQLTALESYIAHEA